MIHISVDISSLYSVKYSTSIPATKSLPPFTQLEKVSFENLFSDLPSIENGTVCKFLTKFLHITGFDILID